MLPEQTTHFLQWDEFGISANKVLSDVQNDTKVIFICSPNNPTGNLLDRVLTSIVTDISCDGMLQGPSLEIIASGGVSNIIDIIEL